MLHFTFLKTFCCVSVIYFESHNHVFVPVFVMRILKIYFLPYLFPSLCIQRAAFSCGRSHMPALKLISVFWHCVPGDVKHAEIFWIRRTHWIALALFHAHWILCWAMSGARRCLMLSNVRTLQVRAAGMFWMWQSRNDLLMYIRVKKKKIWFALVFPICSTKWFQIFTKNTPTETGLITVANTVLHIYVEESRVMFLQCFKYEQHFKALPHHLYWILTRLHSDFVNSEADVNLCVWAMFWFCFMYRWLDIIQVFLFKQCHMSFDVFLV